MFKKIIVSITMLLILSAVITPTIAATNVIQDFDTFGIEADYAKIMIDSIVNDDLKTGMQAETARNNKIDLLQLGLCKISFNDLLLLSKIIYNEAGSSWLSIEWKMYVGEVLLNRVASPEFPNTIKECIYAKGQYYSVGRGFFESTIPNEESCTAALRLLVGERHLIPSVVFQAEFKQGSGTYIKLYDKILGTTYLCISSYPELYE